MRHSYRPDIPPPPQPYRTQVLDHLGLVAGMFEALGITDVIDRATQQDPGMRIVTAGHAVKAMVLNGLGFINHQLYLVPHFFQHKPISRLMAQACRPAISMMTPSGAPSIPSTAVAAIKPRFSHNAWVQMCELHLLPEDWQEMDYADFLEQRRYPMADIIRRGFESLR